MKRCARHPYNLPHQRRFSLRHEFAVRKGHTFRLHSALDSIRRSHGQQPAPGRAFAAARLAEESTPDFVRGSEPSNAASSRPLLLLYLYARPTAISRLFRFLVRAMKEFHSVCMGRKLTATSGWMSLNTCHYAAITFANFDDPYSSQRPT